MTQQTPLHFVFYIAAPPKKVWEGFVSPESNRILFMGAELEVDLKGRRTRQTRSARGQMASAASTFAARCFTVPAAEVASIHICHWLF